MLRGMSLSLTIYLMKMFASIEKDEDFSFFKPFKKIIIFIHYKASLLNLCGDQEMPIN